MTTYSLTLKQIEELSNDGYQGYDLLFDVTIKNYDDTITNLNYIYEIQTENKEAIKHFKSLGFEAL